MGLSSLAEKALKRFNDWKNNLAPDKTDPEEDKQEEESELSEIEELKAKVRLLEGLNNGVVFLNYKLTGMFSEMKSQALRIMAVLVLKQGGLVVVEKEFFETINDEEQSLRLRMKNQEDGSVLFQVVSSNESHKQEESEKDESEAETLVMPNEESSVHVSQ